MRPSTYPNLAFFIRSCCRLRIAVYLLTALALPSTFAADPEDSIDELLFVSLEELLNYKITAPTKSLTRLQDTPGAVSLITYDQIRNSYARTIPELLRMIPGVHVRWNPMVQTIDIRSFGSNPFTSKVLILIDGIPYNSWNKGGFPQHPGFDFFNMENVKHIEIIRGSGSALYGENALNGVINIVTLSGDDYRQTRISYSQNNAYSRNVNLSYGEQFGPEKSLFISARGEESRLPSEFWQEQNADASGVDIFIKGRIKDLQLSYYQRQDQFDGFDQNIVPPNFNYTSTDKISQEVNIFHANYSHLSDDKNWSLQGNLSYADRKGTGCGGCHAVSQSAEFDGEIDHGYQLFSNIQLEIIEFNNHNLLLGAEYRDISAGESFDQVIGAHDDDMVVDYQKGAVFVQDRISIAEEQLALIIGARYDTKTSPDLFDGHLSPRVALVAKPNEKLTLRSSWNKAVRYPSFTELYQGTRFFAAENSSGAFAFPPSNFQPNPNLKPEKIQSVEVGAEYSFSTKIRSKIDLFYNDISNPIIVTYGSGAIGFENHPNNAISSGAELELAAEPFSSVSTFINWSYQHNKQKGGGRDSAGKPIEFTYSPRHKANAGLTFRPNDAFTTTMDLSWRDSLTAPSIFNNPSNKKTVLDSYAYLNLRAKYRIPIKIGRIRNPLTFSFTIKNITDENAIETLVNSSSELPGREFFIGFEYDITN